MSMVFNADKAADEVFEEGEGVVVVVNGEVVVADEGVFVELGSAMGKLESMGEVIIRII